MQLISYSIFSPLSPAIWSTKYLNFIGYCLHFKRFIASPVKDLEILATSQKSWLNKPTVMLTAHIDEIYIPKTETGTETFLNIYTKHYLPFFLILLFNLFYYSA